MTMGETATPTTPGIHNHLGSRTVARTQFDRVFGVDAPITEGLPIEVGHGCKPVEWQLAEQVLRVFVENGSDESRVLLLRLLSNSSINQERLAAELVARNFMSQKTAAEQAMRRAAIAKAQDALRDNGAAGAA